MNPQHSPGRTGLRAAVVGLALLVTSAIFSPSVYAENIFPVGGKVSTDDKEQWISIGMGVRTSFSAQQDASPDGKNYSNNFGIDNARIYINGQLHKYLKFEFNTECFNCPSSINGAGNGAGAGFGGNSNIGVLDLIGKFEFNSFVNLWVGRLLVPGERGELNGPYFHAVYDGFRTPLNQADFSGNFGKGGAGIYGRDNGMVFWGQVDPAFAHVQYSFGVFTGLQSSGSGCGGPCGPNQHGSLLYTGRVTFNFWNPEKNPGYYTAGTYYGKSGDILALAAGFNYQNNGAGSYQHSSDMTIFTSDLLLEKLLPGDRGVLTVNAEFKRYWADYSTLAFTDGTGNFGMFRGNSYTGYVLYLFPQTVGIGRFQPYGRYTYWAAEQTSDRSEWEAGVNYVIQGYNSRVSAFWQYGDIATMGGIAGPNIFAPNVVGDKVSKFIMAYQFQY
jgi:hypothetical protein